jgi:hypothetical protein
VALLGYYLVLIFANLQKIWTDLVISDFRIMGSLCSPEAAPEPYSEMKEESDEQERLKRERQVVEETARRLRERLQQQERAHSDGIASLAPTLEVDPSFNPRNNIAARSSTAAIRSSADPGLAPRTLQPVSDQFSVFDQGRIGTCATSAVRNYIDFMFGYKISVALLTVRRIIHFSLFLLCSAVHLILLAVAIRSSIRRWQNWGGCCEGGEND